MRNNFFNNLNCKMKVKLLDQRIHKLLKQKITKLSKKRIHKLSKSKDDKILNRKECRKLYLENIFQINGNYHYQSDVKNTTPSTKKVNKLLRQQLREELENSKNN